MECLNYRMVKPCKNVNIHLKELRYNTIKVGLRLKLSSVQNNICE